MTTALTGIGVGGTRPIAIGAAYVLARDPTASPEAIDREGIEQELARLDGALARARRHLEHVRAQIPADTPVHIAEFIDTHLLMLTDSALVDATRELIREHAVNASWALQLQRDTLVHIFDQMGDPYLRTRRDDIDHVVRQIQVFLTGDPAMDSAGAGLSGCVVVAEDLTPAEAIVLHQRGVCAFVTEHGGPMSHTAILARSLGIPAVMGVHDATRYLRHGEDLVVNAETGTVLAEADLPIIDHYRARLASADARRIALRRLVLEPTASADGTPIVLLANLELPDDVVAARENGAAGVGLYRTEFLFMNRDDLPDEEEHLAVYREIIHGLDGIPLTIRTLDLGVDKQVMLPGVSAAPQTNPALGLRAIRLCLKEPILFLPQLRAILRASADGPVRLMLPMISGLGEVDQVLQLIAESRRQLRRDGVRFDPLMPIGGMIEVPAAALIAGALAKRLVFLSIGTNDLIQYTLAIDRIDDSVSYLYEPLHPAVLRLIKITIDAAAATRTRVSMCGEMAGDPTCTPLLLGLGLRELSMQPGSLLEVKERVRRCDLPELERQVGSLMARIDELDRDEFLNRLATIARA
jgi:phosphotransferase system enzyme I (PtsI)